MQEILYITVCCLGAVSMTISYCLCGFFIRADDKLAKAFAWNLFGEGFLNSIVFTFSLLEAVDKLRFLPLEYATFLRVLAFIVAVISSIHLRYHIIQIVAENARNNSR